MIATRFRGPIRTIAFFSIALTFAVFAHAQVPLNQRVLVVYNSSNQASTAVANYYATQRSIPSANLCAITPPSTASLTWSQYLKYVKTPVQSCLTAVGQKNILYIVFTYMTPYIVNGSTSPFYFALDSYVADIFDQYAQQDFYPAPTQLQPYYEDAQSMGNVYQTFVGHSFASYRDQGGMLIYSVWRLDGATQALAQGLVDKAISAENSGLSGQVCIDRKLGAISSVRDSDYGEGDWDLHQAATFSGQTAYHVVEDPNPAEFGTAPAPLKCPNDALYSGWYSLNHYNGANVFTWNTGAIGFHLDSDSAANPRGGANWSANAIINGITVTTGSVNEPYLQGLVRPGGTFRDLFQGANLGDAFLRNTRWLKWMILYLGDPLYRPFPNGIYPFNPPKAPSSLALSTRYVLNGATLTAVVTLPSPAPTGGTVVNLSSDNTKLVTVPASVTVPAGSTSATFNVTTSTSPVVTGDTAVRITASGVGQNTLTVSPLLGGLFLNPGRTIGGATSSGLVLLNGNAPAGGAVVALSSHNSSITVPATVTVPAGTSQSTFTVSSSYVTSAITGTITATLLGASVGSSLTIYPALDTLSTSPSSAPGGTSASLLVYLDYIAPAGGWPVSLSSSNSSVASVPSSVTVAAGTRSLYVPITSTPQCASNAVTFTATSGATTLTTSFTVIPPPVSNLWFPTSVKGGQTATATVYISAAACSQGVSVALQSSNPSVASVPSSITIAAGRTSASFSITTHPVSTSTSVTISATGDGATKTRTLAVTP